MTSMFEQDLRNEYARVSTLEEEEAERLRRVIEEKGKYDPAAAERLRREAKELCLDLVIQHDRYLTAGLLYRRAICWANEYQSIIISQDAAKAKMRIAIEWLKVAVDLALLALTLGVTNLYRILLPRMVLKDVVVRGVVPQSLLRTFLTGVPRTGYVAVSGPLIARTGVLSLIRQGHLDKLIVFTLPMFLLKKANQKIAQVVIPLVIANEVGVLPDDVTDYVNRRGVELSIPEPARTLIKFDEERMMSFLAKICVEFDAAVSGNAEFRKLKPDEVEHMKATVLMDFWLGVSRQVESIYVNARNQILKGEANLRELRARTWHENWSRKVGHSPG